MRAQWGIIIGLLFSLIIAIFAVANVVPVEVNFILIQTTVPLIIVILTSVLLGGIMVGSFGIFKQYRLHRHVEQLQEEVDTWKERFETVSKEHLKTSKTEQSKKTETTEKEQKPE